MFFTSYNYTFITLLILSIILFGFLLFLLDKNNKKPLDKIFIISIGLLMFWLCCCVIQIFSVKKYNANPLYFDYLTYISICLLPVSFFFMALIFIKTRIHFKPKYLLLFVVPIISLLILWTNNYHNLFYVTYSTIISESVFGPYFYVHTTYTYVLFAISILLLYLIKNSSFFSKQAVSLIIGT